MLTDYNDLSIKFFQDECIVELKGDADSSLYLITPPQLRHLVRKDEGNAYFHIHIIPIDLPSTQKSTTHLPKIHTLITKFVSLF